MSTIRLLSIKFRILLVFAIPFMLSKTAVFAVDSNRLNNIIDAFCDASNKSVLVVAHRGAHKQFPENSLASIQAAIDMRVDIVEIDVRKTKDDHLVLMHDRTVNRTTNGVGLVSDMTLEQIKKLRLKENDGTIGNSIVPTLEEAMLLAKNKIIVNLDKSNIIISECVKVLKKTNTEKQALFKSAGNSARFFSVLEKCNCNSFYMPIIGSSSKEQQPVDLDAFQKFISSIELTAPEAVEIVFHRNDTVLLSQKAIEYAASKNTRFWANSLNGIGAGSGNEHSDKLAVNDPEKQWGWLIERGVSVIQTDELEAILKYLRSKGLHD